MPTSLRQTYRDAASEDGLSDSEDSPVSPKDNSSEVQGAPIEKLNPLGREVTLLSAIMLNYGANDWVRGIRLVRLSGIYAVPGSILHSVGSIGVLFLYWIIAPLCACAGLTLYCELASLFPKRSGGEVVFLEQLYPKPKFLVPTTFAICAVLMSFTASNAIVFAQYFLTAFEVPITPERQTTTALICLFITISLVALSTKWSLRAINFFTILKTVSLAFVVLTGAAVLLGLTKVQDPFANFKHPFANTSSSFNGLATALVKANHSFVGWHNAFYVLAEVKGSDPVRTVRKASFLSLWLISTLFLFVNVAYVAAVPPEEIRNSGQLVAALFFRRVYGSGITSKLLPLLVAFSCFGNITRMIREVARQGLLPYGSFFSSTRPFGTPLAPAVFKLALTYIVIVAIPAKDAFNFLLDLASYPHVIFQSALCVGIWGLRKRRSIAGLLPSELQAKNVNVLLYLFVCLFLVVMPWVPPESGQGDVSFWYAT
ncbi:amino acid transporter [Amanita rubescens]|nr:amino acid transporter [Amanita rubescens]